MNIFNLESEKFKTVKVNGLKFKIRFMSPLDQIAIAQRRMKLQGGNPVSALTENDFVFFEDIAICDTCIEELPEKAGLKEHESSAKWPDIEMIHLVALEIRTHTNDIEARLKKNKPVEGISEE